MHPSSCNDCQHHGSPARGGSSGTIESLSAIAASRGTFFEKWTPGILVAIVLYSPRISDGAPGLGSKVS